MPTSNNKRAPRYENLLDVVFKISDHLEYRIDKTGYVVVVEKQHHKLQDFCRKLKMRIPEERTITMDEFGSFVFQQIDGRKTVREIGEILEAQYGDRVKPLYERLSLFMEMLEQKSHYIVRVK